MPKQKVTLDVDVPEGYEATEEHRSPKTDDWFLDYSATMGAVARRCFDGSYFETPQIILRKLPDPVEEWLKQHPWLPEGRWVYRWSTSWWITDVQPEPMSCGLGFNTSGWAAFDFKISLLSAALGHTFTPPPVDLVQVKRPSN